MIFPQNANYSPISSSPENNGTYVKPPAPQLVTTSIGYVGPGTGVPSPPRPMNWNRNVPPDKLSFTMRREFEKAKEEAELIQQLRTVSIVLLSRFLVDFILILCV